MSSPESAPPSRGAIAAAEQDLSDAEFAELDALLAAIPEPLEPLDAVMLDGFLCGVIVQPVLPEVEDWLPYVFDAGGHRWGEAEPSEEQRRARALVLRRHAALNRTIAEAGGFDPCVLMPDEGDDVQRSDSDPIVAAVGPWVAGFEQALHLLPALVELDDPTVAAALARLFRFLPDDAGDGPSTDQRERLQISLDDAIGELIGCVAELYELTLPLRYKVAPVRHAAPKVGRNDPCPCGSGRKYKHCHGAAAMT